MARSYCSLFTATVATVGLVAGSAQALQLDFEDLSHGDVVTMIGDVSIDATNFNRRFDIAAAFDSNESRTSDPDLEASSRGSVWSGGNLENEALGTFLILQENSDNCSGGTCSDPDDEGRRPAGSIEFTLGTPVFDFGFDLVDLEDAVLEATTITFFDGDASVVVAVGDFLDPSSPLFDPTIELGNNYANRFEAITAASVGLDLFDRVLFNLGGSTAIDNLNGTVIPEPGSALLIGLGLAGLGMRRRV